MMQVQPKSEAPFTTIEQKNITAMLQSLRPNLSKICWYVVYLGGIAGCSACTNPPPGQPNETNKQAPLVPPPIDHKDPGAGEPPSDPPVQPSPFQQAVQQLKDDPAKKELYDFFKDVSGEQAIPKDAHQAWNKVLQYIKRKGACKAATWLIEEGQVRVDDSAIKGQLTKILGECMEAYQDDVHTGEDCAQLVSCLATQGAQIDTKESTELLKKHVLSNRKNRFTGVIHEISCVPP